MRRCFDARCRGERSRSRESRECSRAREQPPASATATQVAGEGGSSGGNSRGRSSNVDLYVLYASPMDERLAQINIGAELELLSEALEQARCGARLRVGIATSIALAQRVTLARTRGGVILHLSLHVIELPQDQGNFGLVLENAHGGPHVLRRPELEELFGGGQLDGLLLVFLNSCWSQDFAQLLVEAGCKHVIATRGEVPDVAAKTFTQQFYYALGSQQSVLSSWQSAQQVLRVDPNPRIRASADLFLLFGQHGAASATALLGPSLPISAATAAQPGTAAGGANELHNAESNSLDHFPGPLVTIQSTAGARDEALGICVLPPRVEDFTARSTVICEILNHFVGEGGSSAGRRACVVSGPEGIGKSAMAVELAHFASAPGRLFSRAVLFTILRRGDPPRPETLLRALAESLKVLDNTNVDQDLRVMHLQVLQAVEGLERRLGGRPVLLVLDDEVAAARSSPEVRQVLSSLLERTKRLCLVLCSREPIYESLGSCKCVNFPLQPLPSLKAAQLFLKRIHRPLVLADFDPRAAGGGNAVQRSDRLLDQLARHPVLQPLAGHPGRVRALGQRVTPELRSLFDLQQQGAPFVGRAHVGGSHVLQRTMSVDAPSPQPHAQRARAAPDLSKHAGENKAALAAAASTNPELQRKMSVDESPPRRASIGDSGTGSLLRSMSVDEAAPRDAAANGTGGTLSRGMSIDGSQATSAAPLPGRGVGGAHVLTREMSVDETLSEL